MSTDPRAQRWAQVSSWFDQLIDLSAAAQELALAELAERDAELAAEVRAMLIADARTQGVLEQREEVLAPVAAEANPEFGPSWRVQHLLGRGGMGEVWLAQRGDGAYVQQVALKLLKRGMDSDARRRALRAGAAHPRRTQPSAHRPLHRRRRQRRRPAVLCDGIRRRGRSGHLRRAAAPRRAGARAACWWRCATPWRMRRRTWWCIAI